MVMYHIHLLQFSLKAIIEVFRMIVLNRSGQWFSHEVINNFWTIHCTWCDILRGRSITRSIMFCNIVTFDVKMYFTVKLGCLWYLFTCIHYFLTPGGHSCDVITRVTPYYSRCFYIPFFYLDHISIKQIHE